MFINMFIDSLGVVDIKIKKFHPNTKLKQKVFFLKIKGLNYINRFAHLLGEYLYF